MTKNKPLALIVDDESDILELLDITLSRMDIETHAAKDVARAKQLLKQWHFDFCLTDMRLPDGCGIDLVKHIASIQPELPVALITAHGNMESAVAAMKAGAFDCVSKPVDLNLLRRLVMTALRLRRDAPALDEEGPQSPLIGNSVQMIELKRLIAKLARNQAPVFISGESGTGKELAARLIHGQGPRADGPFVPVNCGAIPQELMESEFFGHRKGAFTGAVSDKQGLFQAADGGTLFLDEIADLPLTMQVKLLRAIQEKAIRPVGSQHELPVDTRIISASHRDLDGQVRAGSFRQDLFYRIKVIEVRMPPLRERGDDVPLLASHFVERIATQTEGTSVRISQRALDALQRYAFPGNVRELENIIERAIALRESDLIDIADLYLPDSAEPAAGPRDQPDETQPLEDFLSEMEKQAILKALSDTRWNRTAAAKRLGMSLRSLRYRLTKLGID